MICKHILDKTDVWDYYFWQLNAPLIWQIADRVHSTTPLADVIEFKQAKEWPSLFIWTGQSQSKQNRGAHIVRDEILGWRGRSSFSGFKETNTARATCWWRLSTSGVGEDEDGTKSQKTLDIYILHILTDITAPTNTFNETISWTHTCPSNSFIGQKDGNR